MACPKRLDHDNPDGSDVIDDAQLNTAGQSVIPYDHGERPPLEVYRLLSPDRLVIERFVPAKAGAKSEWEKEELRRVASSAGAATQDELRNAIPVLDRRVWGVYADLVDRTLPLPGRQKYWRVSASGEEVVGYTYEVAKRSTCCYVVFKPSGKPGELMKLDEHMFEQNRGEVAVDGSVIWTQLTQAPLSHREWLEPDSLGFQLYSHASVPRSPQMFRMAPYGESVLRPPLDNAKVQAMAAQLPVMFAQAEASLARDNREWEERRRSAESVRRFNNAMVSIGGALNAANAVATAQAERSGAELQATLAAIEAKAAADRKAAANPSGQGGGQPLTSGGPRPTAQASLAPAAMAPAAPTVPAKTSPMDRSQTAGPAPAKTDATSETKPGRPLRFMFVTGLHKTINRQNAECYSNIVTIEGPPGWPKNPDGKAGLRAFALIEPYRSEFKMKCAAIAPLVGSAPPPVRWNDVDDQPDLVHARMRRIVSTVEVHIGR